VRIRSGPAAVWMIYKGVVHEETARVRSLDVRRGRLIFVYESESEDLPGHALQEFLVDWGWGMGRVSSHEN
jgi:hypothetical protein